MENEEFMEQEIMKNKISSIMSTVLVVCLVMTATTFGGIDTIITTAYAPVTDSIDITGCTVHVQGPNGHLTSPGGYIGKTTLGGTLQIEVGGGLTWNGECFLAADEDDAQLGNLFVYGTAYVEELKIAQDADDIANVVVGNGTDPATLRVMEFSDDSAGVANITVNDGSTLTFEDWGFEYGTQITFDLVGGTLKVDDSFATISSSNIIGYHGQGTVTSEVIGGYTVYTSILPATFVNAGNHDVNTFLFHGIRELTMDGSVISQGRTVNSWTFTKDPVDCNDPTFSVPADALDVTATFTDAGTYTLTLTAEDGKGPVSDSLVVVVAPRNPEFMMDRFSYLQSTFTDNSTTKIKIVSGPEAILMMRDQTPGKQWIAQSGVYQFKLSIEDATGVTIGALVSRLERLPAPYMRACQIASGIGEQGLALYDDLGRAAGYASINYINMIASAGPMPIVHEMGHTLSILAWNNDPNLGDWTAAIAADEISISRYGDWKVWEDAAEFAKLYAICMGSGAEYLDELHSLSPTRFDIWEEMLYSNSSDTDPPTPNAATFASAPAADSDRAISMTATAGTDASGPVEYYFQEVSGTPGGTDSVWQSSPSYTDSGLKASTQYTYTVIIRDSLGNEGTASGVASATTDPQSGPAPGDVITGVIASSTDTYLSFQAPDQAVNPGGTGGVPGLTGTHPDEVHWIDHNSQGQFRNTKDATPTTLWLKLDLGANYNLYSLRVWNGGVFRLDNNGESGINQADLYYSSAAADPGDDFSTGWTLIGTQGTQTFAQATPASRTGGTFAVTDDIDLNGIDARWFAIKANTNHGHADWTGIAEVQFIESIGDPDTDPP